MKKSYVSLILIGCSMFFINAVDPDCTDQVTNNTVQAASGVQKVSVAVETQSDGKTQEQQNVAKRLQMENKPGSIQHLYILSAYSGQVLLYSTVKGKVTSSGKRLSPSLKAEYGGEYSHQYHPELLGDDGTYGTSIEYLYWWDAQGRYNQYYVTGGTMTFISDQPRQFGRVTMQVESTRESN